MSQVLTQSLTKTTFQVTNQSGTDLLVLLATVSPQNNLHVQLYDQQLSLQPTGNGQPLLSNKSVTAFTLSEDPGQLFTLIFAQASNLFPVLVTPVAFAGQDSSQELTVTLQNGQDMKLAEQFVQTITALPGSELAKAYSTALKSGTPGMVNGLFRSLPEYKTLTAEKVVAVQTYYKAYPYVWCNYSAQLTYQLYSSDGTTNTALGSLTIAAPAAAAIASISKLNKDFSIQFKGPGEKDQPQALQYAEGIFRTGEGASQISLQGLFMLKSQLSGKQEDQQIVTVLSGKVNEKEAMGVGAEEENGEPWISVDGLLHPDSLKDWLQLSGIIAGMVVLLLTLATAVAGVSFAVVRRIRKSAGTNTSEEEISREEISKAAGIAEEAGAGVDVQSEAYRESLRKNSMKAMEVLINKQERMLNKLANYENNAELQTVGDNIGSGRRHLRELADNSSDFTPEELLPKIKNMLVQNSRELSSQAQILTKRSLLRGEALEAVKGMELVVETSTKSVEQYEDLRSENSEQFESSFSGEFVEG